MNPLKVPGESPRQHVEKKDIDPYIAEILEHRNETGCLLHEAIEWVLQLHGVMPGGTRMDMSNLVVLSTHIVLQTYPDLEKSGFGHELPE